MAGGLLVALPGVGSTHVAVACVGVALAGARWRSSFPACRPPTRAGHQLEPVSETWRNLKLAHGNIVVFRSPLGISWMWFFGAVFPSQFPSFAKEVLHGNEQVASLLLVVFSVGIGIGSLLCEVLSRRHVEIGLVPLGAIGMSVFAIDLYFLPRAPAPSPIMGWPPSGQAAHWRVMADLLLLSLFAGLYSVPMYALIQMRSQPTHRARIIAANNILECAVHDCQRAAGAGRCCRPGSRCRRCFCSPALPTRWWRATSFAGARIFAALYCLVLSRCIYRFQVRGDAHIPHHGAAILACNHVSFIDAMLLMAASPGPSIL